MRLIDAHTLEIFEFVGDDIPNYAILSHTWEREEVSYHDMLSRSPAILRKTGYEKIRRTCQQAIRDSLEYVWVDTCCIDKTSSAELSEAINSMFKWYQSADRCYVFLSDLIPGSSKSASSTLYRCRWFQRGWTLQELIAPEHLAFYDSTWKFRGNKYDFADEISRFTGINKPLLQGTKAVYDYSVATRMTWAAARQTTREEDHAYSLLGIFGVNMALLYGEGQQQSFQRLQEEIIKRNNDMTIFAWENEPSLPFSDHNASVFARFPRFFKQRFDVMPYINDLVNFSTTNRGLFLSGEVSLRLVYATQAYDGHGNISNKRHKVHALVVGLYESRRSTQRERRDDELTYVAICLRKIGPQVYCRDYRYPLLKISWNETEVQLWLRMKDYHILTDRASEHIQLQKRFRLGALQIPPHQYWEVKQQSPLSLWDETDRCFLAPGPYGKKSYETLLMATFTATLAGKDFGLLLLVDFDTVNAPNVYVFDREEFPSRLASVMFHTRFQYTGMAWHDFDGKGLPKLSTSLTLTAGRHTFAVEAYIEDDQIEFESCQASARRLVIRTTPGGTVVGSR